MKTRLHLARRNFILEQCVDVDVHPVSGANTVHDPRQFPWFFGDREFEETILFDLHNGPEIFNARQ